MPRLDFLEVSPTDVGLLAKLLLCQSKAHSQPIDILPEKFEVHSNWRVPFIVSGESQL
jgi:hypothetical protein